MCLVVIVINLPDLRGVRSSTGLNPEEKVAPLVVCCRASACLMRLILRWLTSNESAVGQSRIVHFRR